MQVNFLKPVTIGSTTYGVGVHHVPNEDAESNWFFNALVADGSAVVLRSEEPEPEVKAEPEAEVKAEPEPEPEPEAEVEPEQEQEQEAPTKTKRNK